MTKMGFLPIRYAGSFARILLLGLCVLCALSLPVYGYDPSCSCIDRSRVSLLLVTDGDVATESAWGALHSGFREACKALRVGSCTVQSADAVTIKTQYSDDPIAYVKSQLQAAATGNANYSAVITALPDPTQLSSSISAIRSRNIPVFSIHVGDQLGLIDGVQHIGPSEDQSSLATRLAQSGGTSMLCVIPRLAYPLYDKRCDLLNAAFLTACASFATTPSACQATKVNVHGVDASLTQTELTSAITTNTANAMVLLSDTILTSALNTVHQLALPRTIRVVTFGSSANKVTTQALSDGTLDLLVDDQSFTQGWQAVILSTYLATTGQQLANPLIQTGPRFLSTAPKKPSRNFRRAHYDVIVHGTVADPYWLVASHGFQAAAGDLDADFTDCTQLGSSCSRTQPFTDSSNIAGQHRGSNRVWYDAPGAQFDLATMASLIERAVEANAFTPNALSISVPDSVILGPPVAAAARSAIPVSASDSGGATFSSLGIPQFVGEDEYAAGQLVAPIFYQAGVTSAICVNHQPGNNDLVSRCNGFASQLALLLGRTSSVPDQGDNPVHVVLSSTDQTSLRADVTTALNSHPGINGMLTVGITGVIAMLGWVNSTIKLGTFDYDASLNSALLDGTLMFAVYQQPHLQSAVALLNIASLSYTGEMPQNSFLYSGPAFITPKRLPLLKCEDAPVCQPPAFGSAGSLANSPVGPARSSVEAAAYCPVPSAAGDQFCDDANNVPGCWDGGDCCASTCGNWIQFPANPTATSSADRTQVFTCGSDFFQSGFNSYSCADTTAAENAGMSLSDRCRLLGEAALDDALCVVSFQQDFPTASVAGIAFWAALVLAIISICAMLLFLHRRHRVIFSASPWFLIAVLVGATMTAISAALSTLRQASAVCHAEAWLAHVGFTIVLLSLNVKTMRLVLIFNLRQLAVKRVRVLPIFISGLAVEILIMGLWSGLSPWNRDLIATGDAQGVAITCNSPYSVSFAAVQVCWKAAQLVAGFYFSHRAQSLPSLFNESKQLSMCFYQLALLSALETLFFFAFRNSMQPRSLALLQSGGLLLGTLSCVFIIFAPKFLYIISGVGEAPNTGTNKSQVTHLTQPQQQHQPAASKYVATKAVSGEGDIESDRHSSSESVGAASSGQTVQKAASKVTHWADRCEQVRQRVSIQEEALSDAKLELSRFQQRLLLAYNEYSFRCNSAAGSADPLLPLADFLEAATRNGMSNTNQPLTAPTSPSRVSIRQVAPTPTAK